MIVINFRDVALLGDCDEGCRTLSDLLGWKEEFESMIRREHSRIDAENDASSSK